MAVGWGVYSQHAQDDEDVRNTILNRSSGQADEGKKGPDLGRFEQRHRRGLLTLKQQKEVDRD